MKLEQIDKKLHQYWQDNKIYQWNPSEPRANNFIIDTPPPTVSGQLHIGHVFSYSHIDFIARFWRMFGKNVFFPIGYDDNGLPTERLVEKQKNIKAKYMSSEEFVKICKEVVDIEESKFKALFEQMGYSFDWDLEYQTISSKTCQISQMSFLDLLAKGHIYRKNQPVLWDPVDQTALAQAEIQDKEKESFMNDISFELENGKMLTIATTRPEMLPACVAVLVNPDDDRYKHLIGSHVITPLFESKLLIVADSDVLIEKGSGAVMCSTFGDASDMLWWRKYNFQTKMIIDSEGKIAPFSFDDNNSLNPVKANHYYSQLQGLKVKAARDKIIQILKESGRLIKQANIKQIVKCAERSGAPLEILITPQWFIKTIEHKDALLALSNQLNWHPLHMKNRLDSWINSVSWDWCISRQRFFGVPFPVWYSKRKGEEGKVILADVSKLPVDPRSQLPQGYSADEVDADFDVMDTWATSCISPQINGCGISQNMTIDSDRYDKTFPADLRPQAHEIIRIWAFGTILKSYLHNGVLPWKNIMISGWCLAEDRNKMSKSKGNIIEPLALLEKYGADALRYWASTARSGNDTTFSQAVVCNGKKLVNKIKNAALFCDTHFKRLSLERLSLGASDIAQKIQEKSIFCTADLWLIAKLNETIKEATNHFIHFEYCNANKAIEQFFWRDFCDTYLEIIKNRIYDDDNANPAGQLSAVLSLRYALQTILKLFSPFLPYITEEIWLEILKSSTSIHIRSGWPKELSLDLKKYLAWDDIIFDILELTHKEKTKKQLSIKSPIKLLQITGIKILMPDDLKLDLQSVTCSERLEIIEKIEQVDNSGHQKNRDIKIKVMF
jgi:valyl-tRNA synthetase